MKYSEKKLNELRTNLEKVDQEFKSNRETDRDAIAPALKYKDRNDREMAGLICAVLAYGKVDQIIRSANSILLKMGESPTQWLRNASQKEIQAITAGWKHRFNDSKDLYTLLTVLRQIYLDSDIESKLKIKNSDSIRGVLTSLSKLFREFNVKQVVPKAYRKNSFHYLFPYPEDGSACKRLNLYLRWVAGVSPFDLSIWTSLDRSKLIIPLDVHLMRISKQLGFTKRNTADWKTAEEVTEFLKKLDPNDPTRFDFALCHLGISGQSFKF
ncbi:MAG: TIGR02757 family protein [Bdellovibrionales bacterium]|nr:TIGR02757 family protein [Bdellovibrionales bacterium]